MPQVKIKYSTFERLQKFARPLIDTLDTVIDRALDALEEQISTVPPDSPHPISPQSLPNVTHTKIFKALLEGTPISNPKWNLLVDELLIHAMKQLRDFDLLQKFCSVHIVHGYKNDNGFRYLNEINVSVQSTNAHKACEVLVEATKSLGYEFEVTFMWRDKEGATYPGESASLRVTNSGEIFFTRKGTTV